MTERLILVLDEGTTSIRAMLFAPDGSVRGVTQQEFAQFYPQPGRVEHDAAETETLARSLESTGGVVIVPAHTGLAAPYWEPCTGGLIAGLSLASGRAEIARAALEAQSHQTCDLAQALV